MRSTPNPKLAAQIAGHDRPWQRLRPPKPGDPPPSAPDRSRAAHPEALEARA